MLIVNLLVNIDLCVNGFLLKWCSITVPLLTIATQMMPYKIQQKLYWEIIVLIWRSCFFLHSGEKSFVECFHQHFSKKKKQLTFKFVEPVSTFNHNCFLLWSFLCSFLLGKMIVWKWCHNLKKIDMPLSYIFYKMLQ